MYKTYLTEVLEGMDSRNTGNKRFFIIDLNKKDDIWGVYDDLKQAIKNKKPEHIIAYLDASDVDEFLSQL